MRVLFLTSHPLGVEAYKYLRDFAWKSLIFAHKDGKLEYYPTEYDLGISFLYNYLIPAEQLTSGRTWINFHPAILPEYRGRNVGYQAIMNGEIEFGATLHYVDQTFDTGDIIEVKRFPILPSEHAGDVTRNARNATLELFKEWIPRFLAGAKPMGFRQLGGTYYKKTSIDPNITFTSELQRQVRAITAPPYFAETTIGGVKYVIIPKSELRDPDHESFGDAETNDGGPV